MQQLEPVTVQNSAPLLAATAGQIVAYLESCENEPAKIHHPLLPMTPPRSLQTSFQAIAAFLMLQLTARSGWAGDLAFSDPANVPASPAWAVGQANRTPDFDLRPGFRQPPPGFGVVPFFWWLGDPLTKERLGWELNQMAGMGISGYQINYAHSDKGGRSYGFTYPSEPPLLSEEWWKLASWFMHEAKQQGAGISLSDYTLGPGQGWCFDAIVREHPEVTGMVLRPSPDGQVRIETVPGSLNPLHPLSGPLYAQYFFGQFEQRNPGEGGKGLNFFFSDELNFGVAGRLWSPQFAEEFLKRKGYDIMPELPALFQDLGPRTPKIRLDYSDVMVALSEEGFFKPVFDWHQQRGMTLGCDHGGRGRNVAEFGDYFRTQRWNQGPGADQPKLGKDLIKSKVASSIAHLYQRPRVWLEGYYGSGWGTTAAGIVDATFADFVMGYNLLSFHGMYYATHGGWWEWAPPDNTFRMPYWKHLRGFMDCVQRLSYVLSQGNHRCDVAILYPVAPVEGGLGGAEAVQTAFQTAEQIYAKGIDFDFMDFESLTRAKVVGQELHVSGEIYRVLVLPAMRAVRHSTLQKALEFHRAGGIVVALGGLPEASDRIGLGDPEVAAMVQELFPAGVANDVLAELPSRDYDGPGYTMHRKVGARDLYAIYNAPLATVCTFRATGRVELWDPWSGVTRPLPVISQTAGMTKLALPLTGKEIQLIVFSPGQPETVRATSVPEVTQVALDGDWEFELQPTLDNRFGDFQWPPTPTLVGAEARQMWYCEGANPEGPWRRITSSFGPQFWKLGPVPDTFDESALVGLREPDQRWQPYEFSWRWGREGDPGHEGYHGLKENVTDEFICLGTPGAGRNETVYGPEKGGTRYYLWTTVSAPRAGPARILIEGLSPARIWLNGTVVTDAVTLKAGANPLLVRYDQPGRAALVVANGDVPPATPGTLAMRWYNQKKVLPFDACPQAAQPVAWYRFTSPPGLRALTVAAHGQVQAWVDGKELTVTGDKIMIPEPAASLAPVLLRIEQRRGLYGGAALPEPIKLDCGPGRIKLGDWAQIDGLLSYSGGAWYRKTVTIAAAKKVVLNLHEVVATAEVRVNGHVAGIKVSPPWAFDITKLVRPGENRIEVLVYNTLANHYTTIPTRYRGPTTAGLIGPASLELETERPSTSP